MVTQKPNTSNLWRATHELFDLLRLENNSENAYQQFLERNPIVFRVLGYDVHQSFEKRSGNKLPRDQERDLSLEPDFLCGRSQIGELTVFELKTPFLGRLLTSRPDGARPKVREKVARHIAQAKDYIDVIRGNADAREVVRKVLPMDTISSYRTVIVAGLSENNDLPAISRYLSDRSPPVEILFFDELLGRLGSAYEQKHEGVTTRPGWAFIYKLAFPQTQIHARAYISDCGGTSRDRISFLREGDLIVFECLDSQGRLHRLQGKCVGPDPHVIRFEFSSDAEGIYMSLHVDDEEKQLVKGSVQFQCDPDLTTMVSGADINGENGAAFHQYQTISRASTLSLREKLDIHSYLSEYKATSDRYIEYRAESYMRFFGAGDMVQEHQHLKPIAQPLGIGVGLMRSQVPANAPKPRISGEVSPALPPAT